MERSVNGTGQRAAKAEARLHDVDEQWRADYYALRAKYDVLRASCADALAAPEPSAPLSVPPVSPCYTPARPIA